VVGNGHLLLLCWRLTLPGLVPGLNWSQRGLSGYFFLSPAVTGPLGQGILQRGPEPAPWEWNHSE